MQTCKTCIHWSLEGVGAYNEIVRPLDPDTYQPMDTGFEVRECQNPLKGFCERPLAANLFTLADGSGYQANLYTGEAFGCVLHEGK